MKNKIFLGIKITDYEILASAIKEKKGGEAECVFKLKISLEKGVIERGRIKKTRKLLSSFSELGSALEEAGITDYFASFAIPENLAYYLHVKLAEKEEKKEEIIEKSIRQDLPFDFFEIKYDYIILPDPAKPQSQIAHILAMEKKVYKEWESFFAQAEIRVDYFCPEALANYQALSQVHRKDDELVALLDMGRKNTNLSFFYNDDLLLSTNFKFASDDILAHLSELYSVQVSYEEIEKTWPFEKEKDYLDNFQKILQKLIKRVSQEIADIDRLYKKEVKEFLFIGGFKSRTEPLKILVEELGLQVKRAEFALDRLDDFSVPLGLAMFLKKNEKTKLSLSFASGQKESSSRKRFYFLQKYLKPLKELVFKFRQVFVLSLVVLFTFLVIFFVTKQYSSAPVREVPSESVETYDLELTALSGKIASSSWLSSEYASITLSQPETLSKVEESAQFEIKKAIEEDEDFFFLTDFRALTGTVVFPLNIEYIVFKKNDLQKYLHNNYGLANESVVYEVHVKGLKENYNKQVFVFDISFESEKKPNSTQSSQTFVKGIEIVRIKNLSSSLNVRSGPGSQYEIVAKADPSQAFVLFSEKDDWLEILLESGDLAWVAKQFVDYDKE